MELIPSPITLEAMIILEVSNTHVYLQEPLISRDIEQGRRRAGVVLKLVVLYYYYYY